MCENCRAIPLVSIISVFSIRNLPTIYLNTKITFLISGNYAGLSSFHLTSQRRMVIKDLGYTDTTFSYKHFEYNLFARIFMPP